MTNIQLESLKLAELSILLGHLRLGEEHLKKQLNTTQFQNLLNLGLLTLEQKINISTNKTEKSGQIALALNTVITSVFGAWMGFSGFLGLPLNSFTLFLGVTCLAGLISSLVGYFTFNLTAQKAKNAVNKQKIYNLQLNVLKLINKNQETAIESLIKFLNHSLYYLKEKSLIESPADKEKIENKKWFHFNDPENTQYWLDELTKAVLVKMNIIEKELLYSFYKDRLAKILNELTRHLEINEAARFELDHLKNPANSNPSFINILTHSPKIHRILPKNENWIKANILSLLAGLFPTLLGGFASMFVFLSGGPNVAKELGLTHIEYILRLPQAQIIEFSIAIGLTLYYGGSFIYGNYKNYLRSRELDKTNREIHTLENKEIKQENQRTLLSQLQSKTKRIINIYSAIEHMNHFKQKVIVELKHPQQA